MARAYLIEREGVRVLVPLDVVKRRLKGTRYVIKKDPPGRGLEADWIGLDDSGRLVIVEAKSTFDGGIKSLAWPAFRTPNSPNRRQAEQKGQTVFRYPRRKLPAKRWAIASTVGNRKKWPRVNTPSLEPRRRAIGGRAIGGRRLSGTLSYYFTSADVDGVLGGMGHPIDTQVPKVGEPIIDFPLISSEIRHRRSA